jgi:RNA polymerase sigma-70 factor, ECF subfamily
MDEITIIKAILHGDAGQYQLLVERYHVGLIIHCERLVGDRQTAEDIAQEAYITAYQKLSTFKANKARFSTWLYRIATNKALDYLRAHKRVVPNENIDELVEEATPDYETEERNIEIREAVDELQPPTFKQVIEAYYWQGKSYGQIATDMDVPVNTVRTWLRRAKVKLRSELS